MYAPFFGLQQEAFSIAPDPRFLHLSAMHREALAHLLYGLQGGGGFVLLTGEIGTGKTTVCRCFLEQIPPGHRVAYLYNPKLTVIELMQTICQEFGLTPPEPALTNVEPSVKPYVDALNEHLLRTHAAGEHSLLVIDEAQGLSADLLEQLRLLTNLETSERKLLQIVLIGQPELRAMLARPELEQLSQRVIARVHLGPLNQTETADYVQHRLVVAGLATENPFDRSALALVHRLTGGVPRRINLLCQRALLGAYAQGSRRIGPGVVRQAAREVFAAPASVVKRWAPAAALTALLLMPVVGIGAAWWWHGRGETAVAGAALRATSDASKPVLARTATSPRPAGSAVASAAELRPFADDQQAWSALAAAWSTELTPTTDVCEQARAQNLACHTGTADLPLLRRLQRPLLLQLQGGGRVLLQSVGGDTAVIQGAAGEQRVTLAALQVAWTGAYSAWWRPPPGWATGAERATGDAASWVLERLVALQGDASGASARAHRDEALRQRVFAFQVAQGLPLDGLAGPVTLMQLNRASGIDEPRLRPEP